MNRRWFLGSAVFAVVGALLPIRSVVVESILAESVLSDYALMRLLRDSNQSYFTAMNMIGTTYMDNLRVLARYGIAVE